MGHFSQYDYDRNKAFRRPAITITKNGAINFNAGILQKYIKNKNYVILYYDRTDKRIGFEFLSEKSTKAFKIRKSVENNFGTITGRPFLNYYDISCMKTNKYHIDVDKETKYLVIDLKKPITKEKQIFNRKKEIEKDDDVSAL